MILKSGGALLVLGRQVLCFERAFQNKERFFKNGLGTSVNFFQVTHSCSLRFPEYAKKSF